MKSLFFIGMGFCVSAFALSRFTVQAIGLKAVLNSAEVARKFDQAHPIFESFQYLEPTAQNKVTFRGHHRDCTLDVELLNTTPGELEPNYKVNQIGDWLCDG